MIRLVLCALGVALFAGCSPGPDSTEQRASAPEPPKVELGPVVYLSTQWYPYTAQDEDETENRIVRELVRQGVLVALRDEMGLVTRDETLGEPVPTLPAPEAPADEETPEAPADEETPATPQPIEPLHLWLEVDADGAWHARLHGAGSSHDNPVWRHDGKVAFSKRTIYAELAGQVADLTDEIAEKLRTAGASGEPRAVNPANKPGEDIERRLGEMNFVSQYGAIRAAHQAILKDGPSLDWLGVLVRGYAHLALLTEHTWSSHSEAFAARALVYADRMGQQAQEDSIGRWHRAYALAIIGAHGAAIDELAELDKNGDENQPAWTTLIEPYVKFEHDGLDAVADDHKELAETVAFLQWNLYESYRHGRWIYEKGMEAMQEVPEAYGVYSTMANWSALRIKRTGSYAALEAFGGLLPKRVAAMADLPAEVKPLTSQEGFLSQLLGRRPQTGFSDRPAKIAQALMKHTTEEASPTECSWAILAQLIAEEQFVEAADALMVAGDAVEHSRAGLVEQFAPLVEGHRYEPYIRSFAFANHEEAKRAECVQVMKVVDPKGNMNRFYSAIWHVPTADGQNGNLFRWRAIWGRNFTLQGMFESYYGSAVNWTQAFTKAHRAIFAEDFAEISPHSPNAIRVPLEGMDSPTAEQLAEVESKMQDDPVGWLALGYYYYHLELLDDAARCYKRSVEISPSMDATQGLANSYYYGGKKELWQPTLEAYLEVEDLGLAHSQIHQMIAQENAQNRNWQAAEPHAVEGAHAYSAAGLLVAARVYEGMQDWEKSEHYISEATRSYPSYRTGTEWYFWCRRTGRGNIDAARQYANRSIEIASQRARLDDMDRTFTYRVLEGDLEGAVTGFEEQMALCPDSQTTWDLIWRKFQIVCACGDLGNDERKKQLVAEIRELVSGEIAESHPNWAPVMEGVCDAFDGEEPSEEFLKTFDEVVGASDNSYRCNYSYLLGVALEQQGRTDLADKYLRMATFLGSFERYNATLAGHRLAQRLGPERGGLPEEFAKIEAEHMAKAEAAAKEVAEEEAAEQGEEDASI